MIKYIIREYRNYGIKIAVKNLVIYLCIMIIRKIYPEVTGITLRVKNENKN
jgi:hypothetical protein